MFRITSLPRLTLSLICLLIIAVSWAPVRAEGWPFTKVTTGPHVEDSQCSFGVCWIDYDNDGWLDLFVANTLLYTMTGQNNNLYHNNGDGTFSKVTTGPLVTDGGFSWAASWGDYNNDGFPDVFVANGAAETNFLYYNNGDGSFTRNTTLDAISSTNNCSMVEYDNDGDLELLVANGFFNPSQPSLNVLYENRGDGTFSAVTTGDIMTDWGFSCGMGWGDYDRDGDLDLYVARFDNPGANNLFYENNGNSNHWLIINCLGVRANRSAIGAIVRARAIINDEPVWQKREITTLSGYACHNSLDVHFGLGDAAVIDTLIISWPSDGPDDILTNISVDQYLTITEGDFCCASRGSVDHLVGVGGPIDVSDLTFLVAYLFNAGSEPPCLEEGNVDGLVGLGGLIDVSALTYLVAYLFNGGPAPTACP